MLSPYLNIKHNLKYFTNLVLFDKRFIMESTKRKRIVLNLQDRLQLIERIDNGEHFNMVAQDYNIGRATVRDIYARKNEYIKYAQASDSMNAILQRKTMKRSEYPLLDIHLYNWFKEQRNSGIPLTKKRFIEQAFKLNRKLGLNENFKASEKWFLRFKSRHGIETLNFPSEPSSKINFEQTMSTAITENYTSDVNYIKIEPIEEDVTTESLEIKNSTSNMTFDCVTPFYESKQPDTVENDLIDVKIEPVDGEYIITEHMEIKDELITEDSLPNLSFRCDSPSYINEQPSCSRQNNVKVTSETEDAFLIQFKTFLTNEMRSIKSRNIVQKLKIDIMKLVYQAKQADKSLTE